MWERRGNAAADARARSGAQLHPWSPEEDERLDVTLGCALELVAWAGWQEAAMCATPDSVEQIGVEGRAIRRRALAARREAAGQLEVTRDEPEDAAAILAARRLAEGIG